MKHLVKTRMVDVTKNTDRQRERRHREILRTTKENVVEGMTINAATSSNGCCSVGMSWEEGPRTEMIGNCLCVGEGHGW